MVLNEQSQTFLFTFRPNGENLAEVLVEELADYDPAVAEGTYKRSWFGTEHDLGLMLDSLGFPGTDIQGVAAALRSHRTADRRLAVTPSQLQNVGFGPVS